MPGKQLWIFLAAVAIVGALVIVINPFGSELKAESSALTIGIEQFIGWVLLSVGAAATALVYWIRPRNIVAVSIGSLSFAAGIFLLADPAGGSVALRFLLAACLLGSGVVKLIASAKGTTGQLRIGLLVGGGLSSSVAVIVLFDLIAPKLFELAGFLALDLLGNGILMAIWA